MKKAFVLFLILFVSQATFAQAGGIQFDSSKWKEVLQKAKDQNKLIFFDAYTSWCGPCKRMQNQVFPNEVLGEFFNANFINVKFDMEKGEGVNLSKKFAVQVYPTLLFIDPKTEKVVTHSIGYKTVEQLLSIGEQAVSKASL